ncbi:MAG: hypothetical protein IKR85_06400 [Clostridia bacterium]|nr:hypothetical protein [Clostridia bacterium]
MSELLSGDAVVIVCLALGAVMLAFEAITPGMGLPGMAGVGFMAVGTALMWINHGSTAGLISLFATLVISVCAVLISIKSASKGKLSKSKMILNGTAAAQAIDAERALVDKTGTAATKLNPVGEAEIDGRSYSVLSESGFVMKGDRVKVVRTEGKRIYVRKVDA